MNKMNKCLAERPSLSLISSHKYVIIKLKNNIMNILNVLKWCYTDTLRDLQKGFFADVE